MSTVLESNLKEMTERLFDKLCEQFPFDDEMKENMHYEMRRFYNHNLRNRIHDINFFSVIFINCINKFVLQAQFLLEAKKAKQEMQTWTQQYIEQAFQQLETVKRTKKIAFLQNDIHQIQQKVAEYGTPEVEFGITELETIIKKIKHTNFTQKPPLQVSSYKQEKFAQIFHELFQEWINVLQQKRSSYYYIGGTKGISLASEELLDELVVYLQHRLNQGIAHIESFFKSFLDYDNELLITLLGDYLQDTFQLESKKWNPELLDLFLNRHIYDEFINLFKKREEELYSLKEEMQKPKTKNINFHLDNIFSTNEREFFESDLREWLSRPLHRDNDDRIEKWFARVWSWYEQKLQKAYVQIMHKYVRQLYAKEYLQQYASLYHRAYEELIRGKPKKLEDYPAFKQAKQSSEIYEGENHRNIKMPILGTRLWYELQQQAVEAFFEESLRKSSSEQQNSLLEDLSNLPEFVFLRYPKYRKRKLPNFDFRIFAELDSYEFGQLNSMNMAHYLGRNVFSAQPGIPLKDFPGNPFVHFSIRDGIIDLMIDAIQKQPVYWKPEQMLPENYDSQTILRLYCNYSKKIVYRQYRPYYQELFDDLGFPEEVDLFASVEKRLHTLTRVPFVFGHGDRNGGNILVEEVEKKGENEPSYRVHGIDEECRYWGPAGLDFAFFLGRNEMTEIEQEQLTKLWLKKMPSSYVKNGRRDLKVYLDYEMIKSAIIDAVRCQQALMIGDLSPEEREKRLAMAVKKINQAYHSWGKPEIDVLSFQKKIEHFNQQRQKQLSNLVRKYQKMYKGMYLTEDDLEKFVKEFNPYRLFWDKDADFNTSEAWRLLVKKLPPRQFISQAMAWEEGEYQPSSKEKYRSILRQAVQYEPYSRPDEIFPSVSREQLIELLEKSPHERDPRNRRTVNRFRTVDHVR